MRFDMRIRWALQRTSRATRAAERAEKRRYRAEWAENERKIRERES